MTNPPSQPTLSPDSAPPSLRAFLAEVVTWVDAELARRLTVGTPDPGRLGEAMRYAATGPGKRLRPAVVAAAAAAIDPSGASRPRALLAATAIEVLHAYTLVHDDLPAMDDDDERRGRPTVHVAFDEAIAILAGDGLLTLAFGLLGELGEGAGAAAQVLARRAGHRELLLGQALDLAIEARGTRPTLEEIEVLHAGKTGALFAAAAELGGIAAGATAAQRAQLAEYGLAIGVAFQHADDRDDAEFTEHAAASAARMRELCARATQLAAELTAGLATEGPLLQIAQWMGARA
jgi:geranylgeranyl pyrophosphate synthase